MVSDWSVLLTILFFYNYANLNWELNAKILGIYAGIDDVDNANWSTFIDRIAKQIDYITQRELTLIGRSIILNSKILSQLWYKATIIDILTKVLQRMENIINKFMWHNKMPIINRETLTLPVNDGGINLVNIPIKVKSFEIKHGLDLIYGTKSAEWKAFWLLLSWNST